MTIEWWVVLATLAGPVIAVQTQKFIERATESRRRRLQIFNTLMANRATRLADDYVRALNLIDIEFLPRRFGSTKDREVINAWRELFGEFTQGIARGETDQVLINAWHQRCDDRLIELLSAMSSALGYSFSKEELRRGIYYPQGHVEREQAQLAILAGLKNIVSGDGALRMKVTEVPVSDELVNAQRVLAEKSAGAYDKDGAFRVRMVKEKE